jgi:hypothetical protein
MNRAKKADTESKDKTVSILNIGYKPWPLYISGKNPWIPPNRDCMG